MAARQRDPLDEVTGLLLRARRVRRDGRAYQRGGPAAVARREATRTLISVVVRILREGLR